MTAAGAKARRAAPRSLYPRGAELDYAAKLRRRLRAAARGVRSVLVDGELEDVRFDSSASDEDLVRRAIGRVRVLYFEKYTEITDESLALEVEGQVTGYIERQTARQVKTVLGVDVLPTAGLKHQASEFTRDSVAMIRSVGEEFFQDLEADILGALQGGARWEQLSGVISERYGISAKRANLIARDQMGTLVSRISQAKQQAAGATKYIWRTSEDERVVGAPGNKSKPNMRHGDHHARNGKLFTWDRPPHDGHPGEAINCLPGDSKIDAGLGVEILYRRWFDGELAQIVTESGKTLRATPNHPVLTQRGWVPIQLVNEGDYVFEGGNECVGAGEMNVDSGAPRIEDMFNAFSVMLNTMAVTGSSMQFHGDGTDEKVEIVRLESVLPREMDTLFSEEVCKYILVSADEILDGVFLEGQGAVVEAFGASFSAPECLIRGACKLLSLFTGELGHSDEIRSASAARLNSVFEQSTSDYLAAYSELFRQGQLARTGDVKARNLLGIYIVSIVRRAGMATAGIDAALPELDAEVIGVTAEDCSNILEHSAVIQKTSRVVEKRVSVFSGHVYNLQTKVGWYIAQGLATRNCRCTAEPVWDDEEVDAKPADESDLVFDPVKKGFGGHGSVDKKQSTKPTPIEVEGNTWPYEHPKYELAGQTPGYVEIGNSDLLFGNRRGKASKRAFNYETSGPLYNQIGLPIEKLSMKGVTITSEGIKTVELHLARFGSDGENEAMVERLRRIAAGDLPITDYDVRFYTHELREFERYKALGFEFGEPEDDDESFQMWVNQHTATLEEYGIHEEDASLYHPEVKE